MSFYDQSLFLLEKPSPHGLGILFINTSITPSILPLDIGVKAYYTTFRMNTKTQKEKLNLSLPKEAIIRAKTLAAQMNISTSHFIEGLIMGVQIVPGNKEDNEKQN